VGVQDVIDKVDLSLSQTGGIANTGINMNGPIKSIMDEMNDSKPKNIHHESLLLRYMHLFTSYFTNFFRVFALRAESPNFEGLKEMKRIGEVDFSINKNDPLMNKMYQTMQKKLPKHLRRGNHHPTVQSDVKIDITFLYNL